MTPRRRWLLTTYKDGSSADTYKWTLPAWAGKLPDGRNYNTCPGASACAPLCYARTGTYRFRTVKAAHEANLMMVLDDLPGWEAAMKAELQHKRYRGGKFVRCHDAGDFFSVEYLQAWLRIFRATPDVTFYAYTKSIPMFLEHVKPNPPPNFKWVFSLGGRWDHLIDLETERHVDVFPDEASVEEAGYTSRGDLGDLVSILGPRRVGLPANNIKHLKTKQAGKRFSELQRERDKRRRGPGKQFRDSRP
ncbi:hypothetical protein HHL19_35400 [Streptomyces sp. R302]|uniref:GP88 family protein n=1 Tax=unclassified Streptomyces TaxID=2593676 RepID=UPI00145C7AE6|nr:MULTISPECIES: hypothetical protein [unclassified Streptomyces]NML55172.1 hypothetical protein [Streptomyces sp. R301]NML83798.1 hypothetical protein [Streptomyces sp. R302]